MLWCGDPCPSSHPKLFATTCQSHINRSALGTTFKALLQHFCLKHFHIHRQVDILSVDVRTSVWLMSECDYDVIPVSVSYTLGGGVCIKTSLSTTHSHTTAVPAALTEHELQSLEHINDY